MLYSLLIPGHSLHSCNTDSLLMALYAMAAQWQTLVATSQTARDAWNFGCTFAQLHKSTQIQSEFEINEEQTKLPSSRGCSKLFMIPETLGTASHKYVKYANPMWVWNRWRTNKITFSCGCSKMFFRNTWSHVIVP